MELGVALRHSIIHRWKPHKLSYLGYMLVKQLWLIFANLIVCSLPILCINFRNNFGNNCLFGKNVTHIFKDRGEFITVGTIYAIQYSWFNLLCLLQGFSKCERVSPPSEKKIQLSPPPQFFFLNTCVLKAILIILHISNISDHNFKTFGTYFWNIWNKFFNIFFKHISETLQHLFAFLNNTI